MSSQWKPNGPAAKTLVVMLLFILSSYLLAQPTEAEVAAKITQAGGLFNKDKEGNIIGVMFGPKKPFMFALLDEDIESVDFSVLSRLKSLSILSQRVTNRSLVQLQKIPPGLDFLCILGAQITDKELAILLQNQSSSLISVGLIQTPITDRTLAEIGKMEKVLFLRLRGTKITDIGLKSLVKLQELRTLDLSGTNITDAGLEEVIKLTKLSRLRLEETKITDAGILQLAALKELEFLHISSTKVTEKGKKALQQLLPNVEFMKD